MKWNKDLFALVIGQLLLLALIGLWLRGVYIRELDGLKAETTVIFFNAIEEANEKLFLKLHSSEIGTRITSDLHFGQSDSLIEHQIFVFEGDRNDSDSFHIENHVVRDSDQKPGIRTGEVTFDFKKTAISAMLGGRDSTVNIDFDTTRSYLSNIFLSKVHDSKLGRIRARIVENPDQNRQSSSFTTDAGSLGNIFFGTSEFAAEVDHFDMVIFRRMLPEIGMATFIYLAIFLAFYVLYQNLTKARKLAVLKDDFISNMSHELKTPISVVRVAIEALGDFDVLKSPQRTADYLNISKNELDRLSGMVDKVLDISVLNEKGRQLALKKIDPVSIMNEVIRSMEIKGGGAINRIDVELENPPERVVADAEQLKTVFYNLVDNAVKYGNQEPVKVWLGKEVDQLVVRITNRGRSIPEGYGDQIFEKFFRVPNENIHNVKGYGLGLYHVKQILDHHRGTISLHAGRDGGTTALIKIPIGL